MPFNIDLEEIAALPHVGGVGLDIVRLDRIARVHARYGDRFVRRILGDEEIQAYHRRAHRDAARGLRYLATRFAAKEAFSKAIGLGMRSPMSWRRMQVLNTHSGRPSVALSEPLGHWYVLRYGTVHVSITDETDMVAALVVVEADTLVSPEHAH